MANLEDFLKIDPTLEEQKIIAFLKRSLKDLNRNGAAIGLSGGLDSSTVAYLLKKALDKNKILALILPERDSDPKNIEHARLVAKTLDLEAIEINITEILEKIGVYKLMPERNLEKEKIESIITNLGKAINTPSLFTTGYSQIYGTQKGLIANIAAKFLSPYLGRFTAFAFPKVRLRMIFLYYYAMLKNFALVGTSDKSEWTIGFFDKYGDGAHDISPLRHLYKTQIRKLAEYIGVPKEIINKPSSGDLIAGLPNETLIGLTYEQLDQILYALDHKYLKSEIIKTLNTSPKILETIKLAIQTNKKIQSLPLALD